MKKLVLLTAATISITMLGSLSQTAEAACRNFNSRQVTVTTGQNAMIWSCQEDLKAFLDSIQGSGCIVMPSNPTTIGLPGGNGTVKPEAPVITPQQQETPEAGNTDTNGQHAYVKEVVRLVNQERTNNGLKPLTIDTNVQAAAQVRAKEIQSSFSHTRPDGSSYNTALQEQQVSYRGSGENIAWGQQTPEQVMQGWMNSSSHRANILNSNFTSIGVGYYQGADGVNYWSQLFTY